MCEWQSASLQYERRLLQYEHPRPSGCQQIPSAPCQLNCRVLLIQAPVRQFQDQGYDHLPGVNKQPLWQCAWLCLCILQSLFRLQQADRPFRVGQIESWYQEKTSLFLEHHLQETACDSLFRKDPLYGPWLSPSSHHEVQKHTAPQVHECPDYYYYLFALTDARG